MVTEASLHQVLNGLAQGTIAPAPKIRTQPLSELEAFAALDPLLADLFKRFLEAKSQTARLTDAGDAYAAMADVAADMEDSAWCAMQTRYIELRADGALMRRAQAMMADSEAEEIRERAREKERAAQAAMARIFPEKEKSSITLAEVLFYLYYMQWAIRRDAPSNSFYGAGLAA